MVLSHGPFDPGSTAESIPFGIAIARAQPIVYMREIEEVRSALRRAEAGLPSDGEYPQGSVSVSEYNQRITGLIREERAVLDKVEADSQSALREMERKKKAAGTSLFTAAFVRTTAAQ